MDMQELLKLLQQKDKELKDSGYGNFKGLENTIKGSTDTAKTPNMATGGEVPPMMGMNDEMSQTPPTDYSFYKNIDSDTRAKLAQDILAKRNSGSNLVGQGIAGIGDAIQNSYGGKSGVNGMGDLQARQQKMGEDQLSAIDTQRSQRLGDMQGNQEMMMNDPNSPLSQSMRAILKSQGINVPSGMNAAVALKVVGPLGELAYKQSMINMTGAKNTADITNAKTGRIVDANKALEGRGVVEKIKDAFVPSDETTSLKKVAAGDEAPAAKPAPHGQTIVQNGHTYTWNGSKYE